MDEITIIGLKELRENMEAYITKIQRGDSFVVVRKSKVVFRIAPNDDKKLEDKSALGSKNDSDWEEVVDFTKVRKGGVSIDDILTRL